MNFRLATAWVLWIGAAACGPDAPAANPPAETAAAAARTVVPPKGPVAAAPWADHACDPAVRAPGAAVCVAGAAVGADRVRAAWQAHPSWSREQALDAVISEEVLAQAAASKGLWSAPAAQTALHQAMAQAVMSRAMQQVTPATIAMADVVTAFKNPAVRAHYDHAAAYFAVDAQILCCSGDHKLCAERDEVRACIAKNEPLARKVYDTLLQDPPASGAEMWARTKVLAATYPELAAAEVPFFYDPSKSHEAQKGYDLMVKEYALAVTALKPGQLSEPIRTSFGWHVAYLDKIDPARRDDPKSPAVRAEIAANIVDGVREREAVRFAHGLMQKRGVLLFFERIDAVAGVRPPDKQGETDSDEP